jgi:hypothetical protein
MQSKPQTESIVGPELSWEANLPPSTQGIHPSVRIGVAVRKAIRRELYALRLFRQGLKE